MPESRNDSGLLEGGEGAALAPEDFEELIPEGLALGLLGGGAAPLAGELDGAVFDFV